MGASSGWSIIIIMQKYTQFMKAAGIPTLISAGVPVVAKVKQTDLQLRVRVCSGDGSSSRVGELERQKAWNGIQRQMIEHLRFDLRRCRGACRSE